MDDHLRDGRRYVPELVASVPLSIEDWVRDDLPDLLWPVLLLALQGTDAGSRFVKWQGAVQRDLNGRVETKVLGELLDGRLTSLDRLVRTEPDAAAIVRRRADEFGLLPNLVARVLTSYPERPSAWLLDDDWHAPSNAELDLATRALVEVIRDGHREAVIKCLPIWSAVQAGTFRSSSEMIELLKPYPNDEGTRSRADTCIRAAWGAMKGLLLHEDSRRFDEATTWAKVFWGVNSMTTRCLRRREIENGEEPEEAESPPSDGPSEGRHLQQLAKDLVSSYVEALETGPARLYDQERQEVHAGLVVRAGREVITVLGCPDLWCAEHGSHVTRTLVEVRIYLEWMAMQDPSIYRRFQDFGSGKAKLYRRILHEVPTDARIPGFDDALEELHRLSHNGDPIDFRVVDTADSFSGKSIRAMAQECGLIDLYRHAYYLSSGVAHSEWWSVETHALERCLNVLHRFHLIPSLSLNVGANLDLANGWIGYLHALIRASLKILGTEESTVSNAFAWLTEAEPNEDDEDSSSA